MTCCCDPSQARRAVGLLVLFLALAAFPRAARGQADSEQVADHVAAVSDALQRLADLAAAGAWPQADAAFNGVLDTLDEHRPVLEAALGAPATETFAGIDALLPDLDRALSAEDSAGIQAVVALSQARLARLVPDQEVTGPPEEATTTVLRWRGDVDRIIGLGAAGQWRDMRNAAIDLVADVERRGPAVVRAGGPASEADVQQVRVFAMRLRAAALDQSLDDGQHAGAVASEALGRLLVTMGVLPTPRPTPPPAQGTRFVVPVVPGAVGEVVTVPVLAESLPSVGLGAYRLRVRWSPSALHLGEVTYDVGRPSIARDDAAGTVELSLPPAPTGPSGDVVLVRMQMEVIDSAVDPMAYLPGPELEAVQAAMADADRAVRRGDVPQAASRLTDAYLTLAEGRGRPGSLYESLEAAGAAGDLMARLLDAVDLASQPAATDETVAAMVAARTALNDAIMQHMAWLSGAESIPIVLEVLDATDTTGAQLVLTPAAAGGVLLGAGISIMAAAMTATPPSLGTPGAAAGVALTSSAGPAVQVTAQATGVPTSTEALSRPGGSGGVAAATVPAAPAGALLVPLAVLALAAAVALVAALAIERDDRGLAAAAGEPDGGGGAGALSADEQRS